MATLLWVITRQGLSPIQQQMPSFLKEKKADWHILDFDEVLPSHVKPISFLEEQSNVLMNRIQVVWVAINSDLTDCKLSRLQAEEGMCKGTSQ